MRSITPPRPLLLMLMLLVAMNLEGSPNTSVAPDCPADIVVKEGETRVVFTEDIKFQSSSETGWYVKPGSDIENVRFVVVGSDGTDYTAWFPIGGCFQNDDDWWKFTVETLLNNSRFGFVLRFVSGECWKGCQFNTAPPELFSLSMMVHGSSSWREYSPFYCDTKFSPHHDWPDSLPPCMDPSSSTHIPEQCSFMLGSMVSVALMVVVVVVVVVVVCWKWRLTSSNEVRFQPQPEATRPQLQLTTGQGLFPEEDEHHIYYTIMPDLSESRVVVPRPARDLAEPMYDDVMPECSVLPLPSSVCSPNRLTEAPGHIESHVYDTVV